MAFPHLTPSISLDGIVRWMSPEYFISKPRAESEPELESDSESDSESELGLDATSLTTQLDMWSYGCTLFEVGVFGKLDRYQCKLTLIRGKDHYRTITISLVQVRCSSHSKNHE